MMRENLSESEREIMSPSKREYQRVMAENLQKPDLNNTRILAYQQKAPAAPEGHANNLKILYSQSKTHSTVKSTRHIPQVLERILDAPDIVNDYYLNLLDWSSNNHLAVALGAHVYLWNAGSRDQRTTADRTIKVWNASNGSLLNTVNTKSQVCSLVWASEYKELVSSHGYANNEVVIWRYPQMTRTAELLGHTERVLHTALSPDGSTLVSAGAELS